MQIRAAIVQIITSPNEIYRNAGKGVNSPHAVPSRW